MEAETRIALAQSKAMARRMLGDEKGAMEYEVGPWTVSAETQLELVCRV